MAKVNRGAIIPTATSATFATPLKEFSRYSKLSVPLLDTATEIFYYWGFAIWIAYSTICPDCGKVPTAPPSLCVSGIDQPLSFIRANSRTTTAVCLCCADEKRS